MPYNQVDPKLPLLTMDGDVMSGVQGHILKNCPPVGWAPRPHGLAPVLPGLSPALGATHPPRPPPRAPSLRVSLNPRCLLSSLRAGADMQ